MDQPTNNKTAKYEERDLVIVDKRSFPLLDLFPIDSLSKSTYERLERLASWFVLRAPLTDVTKLANPSLIGMFKSDVGVKRGSRAKNRVEFDERFLNSRDIDCSDFEFVYTRRGMKPQLIDKSLLYNDSSVFDIPSERGVVFVGSGEDKNVEDSCIESICRHVRNALAHGRIVIQHGHEDPLMFIEDGCLPRNVYYGEKKQKGPKLEIRFRMVVRLSTLEYWYEQLVEQN